MTYLNQSREEVLAHVCRGTADVKLTCTALCVSRSTRELVFGVCTRTLTIAIGGDLRNHARVHSALQRTCQQSYWLSKYGSLVRHLDLNSSSILHEGADEQVMYMAFRPESVRPESLTLNLKRPDILLRELHCTHLTSLVIDNCSQFAHPGACQTLARLTGLQQLALNSTNDDMQLHEDFILALSPLTRLTQLNLGVSIPLYSHLQLPQSVRTLTVTRLPSGANIQHLSELTDFTLASPACEPSELLEFNNMTAITDLAVTYSYDDDRLADRHAYVWAQLHQLRSLSINWMDNAVFSTAVAAGVAGATGLTNLYILVPELDPAVNPVTMLKPLTRLQQLSLIAKHEVSVMPSFCDLFSEDLTRLTALELVWPEMRLLALTQVYNMTNLKSLLLSCENVTDEGLYIIGNNLKQLQVLGVGHCNISLEGFQEALQTPGFFPSLQQVLVVDRGFEGPEYETMLQRLAESKEGLRVKGYPYDEPLIEKLEECKRF